MKKNILVIVVLLFVGCTSENQFDSEFQNVEKLQKEDSLLLKKKGIKDYTGEIGAIGIYDCSSTPIPAEEMFIFYIEWKDGVTEYEKHQVRLSKAATGYLLCVDLDYCASKPNAELWTVKGYCPPGKICRPKVQIPTDPEIRMSSSLNQEITSACE